MADSETPDIIYTTVDEAPELASASLLPIIRAFASAADVTVDIFLCDSGFDTKLIVYENDRFHLIACNDDACGL